MQKYGSQLWEHTTQVIGPYAPRLLGAILVLLIGWMIALSLAGIVRGLLRRTTFDDRIARWIAGDGEVKPFDLENWISKIVYYILMIVVMVAFFETLRLTIITEPLNRLLNQLFEFAPRLLGAGLLLFFAWILATMLRMVVLRVLRAARFDQRLRAGAGIKEGEEIPLSKRIAETLYWLVLLLFVPAVLGDLALYGILSPIQAMMNKLLGFLPNLFAAGLTLLIGWFLARIVRQVVTHLLAAVGLDRLGEKVGLTAVLGTQTPSALVGMVVYILMILPVAVASLNSLGLEAVTAPASSMLNRLLAALPAIFGATLVIAVAYIVGRLVAGMVTTVLTGVGFNKILVRLGLGREPREGERTPAAILGSITFVAILVFGSMEATRLLGFTAFAGLLVDFLKLAGHIALGLCIFAIGLYLAHVAANAILATSRPQASVMARVARIAILLLTGAMGLRQMGLANEIINLAFGLVVGAVAIAVAIAFGIGGRDLAARRLEDWSNATKKKEP